MELTTLDRELLDGLKVLTDEEISRVQAHLAAGLPMQIFWGYPYGTEGEDEAACFGCLVGTAMPRREARRRGLYGGPDEGLAQWTFPNWARAQEERAVTDRLRDFEDMLAGRPRALPQATLARLSSLLDMEWNRRHPVTASTIESPISPPPAVLSNLKEAVSVG